MAAITEDYVSFETAKLLKEKGFPQEYDNYHALVYNEEDYEDEYEVQRMVVETKTVKAGTLSSYPIGVPEPKCYCPTLQMAMKWLREIHDKNIIFNMIPKGNDCYVLWTFNILANKNYKIIWGTKQPKYKTYEEAAEAALKYSLENLI